MSPWLKHSKKPAQAGGQLDASRARFVVEGDGLDVGGLLDVVRCQDTTLGAHGNRDDCGTMTVGESNQARNGRRMHGTALQ